MLLAGLVLMPVAPAAAAAGRRVALGHLAGYVWEGTRVGSVSATFAVPRILPGSPAGAFGATWIGAQAPGVDGPFIQIGVNEVHLPKPLPSAGAAPQRNLYYAFWSDTRRHFRPTPLFTVRPGDQVAVSLRLVHGGWRLAIVDATRGTERRFFTHDEAVGAFNWAEWLQENPTGAATRKALPYPRLAGVHFDELRVDYTAPNGPRLVSQWLTMARGYIGPSRLLGDAFSEGRRTLGSAAAGFWRLAIPEDAAANTFEADTMHWSATTPRAQVAAESALFATALRVNIGGFERARWPQRLRPFVAALVHSLRGLLAVVVSAPARVPLDLDGWLSDYRRAATVGRAGWQIIIRSHGPQLQ